MPYCVGEKVKRELDEEKRKEESSNDSSIILPLAINFVHPLAFYQTLAISNALYCFSCPPYARAENVGDLECNN